MAIKDEKQKIFGKIGALRTLNEGYPKFNLKNSFPAINNKNDGVEFLTELITSLIGSESLKTIAIDFLTTKMDVLEVKLRNNLKNILNVNICLCTNPTIPSFLSVGTTIPIKSLDFYDKLKVDPRSRNGKLMYDDVDSGLSSSDFDTFLFELLQDTNEESWGNQMTNHDILDITPNNNDLIIKINQYYNNKTLGDLNNDYLDSIKLYDAHKVINNIVDKLFGSISVSISKTDEQLITEGKIKSVIDNLINSDDDAFIDDSYFTFTNEKVREIEEIAKNRGNGIAVLYDCNNYVSSVSVDILSGVSENIALANTESSKKVAITNGLTTIADASSVNASDNDKTNVKLSFFKNFIKELTETLVSSIITPKLIIIILINTKIIDNTNTTTDALKIIKDNKVLIKSIVNECKNELTNVLLSIVVKEIIKLASAQVVNKEKEAAKNKVISMLSLLGVPQQLLTTIRGL
jgi:hypothetical protein